MSKLRRLRVGVMVAALIYLVMCLALSLSDPPLFFSAQQIRQAQPNLPSDFLLGTATAAYQVEGGNPNCDWSEFEKEQGRIAGGAINGRASDHWNQWASDISLMQDLGANAYRFSLEWSRLEPQSGIWNEPAWIHYQEELRQLRAANITPMVTLLHFTLPTWLARRGGTTAPDFPDRFDRFAGEAARRLGPEVKLWCTLNEPNVQMLAGYVDGVWPPGKKDPAAAARSLLGLAQGHARAAQTLHRLLPQAQVGVAINLTLLEPYTRLSLLDWAASRLASQAYNWALCDALVSGRLVMRVPGWPTLDHTIPGLAGSIDYFGFNYYTRYLIQFSPTSRGMLERRLGPGKRTQMGWEVYPEGLLRLLRASWQRYHLPIYITENGIADATGQDREEFIQAHLYAVSRALAEGIPVKGYFHWSLLDNFEWAEGFRPRFGLYTVDRLDYRRAPAPGCATFKRWSRGLELRGADSNGANKP